ncbi:MAG: hypothetical protein M0004_15045 [Actinomycetota bacterium]|nr:hypothetical protein [Actinomycetota bacterium]
MSERRYVTTDHHGTQHSTGEPRRWNQEDGSASPEATPAAALDAVGLVEWLDERVFAAEIGASGALRLGDQLPFGPERAASFALDCLEHAFGAERDLALPRGRTLGEVIDEARRALSATEPGTFTALARFARLRHLRRTRDVLGATAFSLAKQDEREDLELADDPAWATLAALGEGVLAALEAVREVLGPRDASRPDGAVSDEDAELAERGESPWITPWGPLSIGIEHVPAHRPAAQCAREAAERARQAVADRLGEPAGVAEHAWQAARLEEVLGLER